MEVIMREIYENAVAIFLVLITAPIRCVAFVVGVAVFQWKAGYKNGRNI
jgi:hypothetical protein